MSLGFPIDSVLADWIALLTATTLTSHWHRENDHFLQLSNGLGGRAPDTSSENTTDNRWLNVCQDMGRRKMCPWQLKRFWIEHDLFWQLVLYQWLFFSQADKEARTQRYTQDENIFFKRSTWRIEKQASGRREGITLSRLMCTLWGWPGPPCRFPVTCTPALLLSA